MDIVWLLVNNRYLDTPTLTIVLTVPLTVKLALIFHYALHVHLQSTY
jgi:hypothetical protein